jgi:hypothetical protein
MYIFLQSATVLRLKPQDNLYNLCNLQVYNLCEQSNVMYNLDVNLNCTVFVYDYLFKSTILYVLFNVVQYQCQKM